VMFCYSALTKVIGLDNGTRLRWVLRFNVAHSRP
jgi:hypothetical protein